MSFAQCFFSGQQCFPPCSVWLVFTWVLTWGQGRSVHVAVLGNADSTTTTYQKNYWRIYLNMPRNMTRTPRENGTSFQGRAFTVISANIEGLSAAKQQILADRCSYLHCDVLCLQETHRGSNDCRPTIPGMVLIAESPHPKYGSAMFAKANTVCKAPFISATDNLEVISVEFCNIVITSIYKPPATTFNPQCIPIEKEKPQVIIGDFNSHSTTWGYNETNHDGESVEEWIDYNQLNLIHDSKLPASFHSARWRRGYNPDLAFTSNNIEGLCQKLVLDPIPSSQHRPIGIQATAAVKPTTVPFKRRFNYKKANWQDFTNEVDQCIEGLEPTPTNYERFTKLIQRSARRHIPRGCRQQYIPGLSKESSALYQEYVNHFENDPFSPNTTELGKELSNHISLERRNTWQTMIGNTDMARSSKKAWATIKKLRSDPKAPVQQPNVTANQVAHQLLLNGRGEHKPRKSATNLEHYSHPAYFTRPFDLRELEAAIKTLKPGKAIGPDLISTEQINNFGLNTKMWVLKLFNHCATTYQLPKIWKKAHVIALLKPGKVSSDPKSYRPISLLSHLYKLFERILLNRIGPAFDEMLIPEQAGFRPGKSTTSQVLNLTQHIEDGFEERKVTGLVLVDLTAAYDTVNHRLLLSKLQTISRDSQLTKLVGSMLENRSFFVELSGKKSRWRRQNNGLPQGSVLSPLLFNIYTNDLPLSQGTRRFLYADDLAVTAQYDDFTTVENHLSGALSDLAAYYKVNNLRANPSKTQVCSFHLRNQEANRKLNISWLGSPLENCEFPVYLGVTLDRSLTYKKHVEKTRAKVSARNNVLRQLRGTTWGATPGTLRSTALALSFSAAEYACPVWERSAHAKKIDPTLNSACRLITGCLKPTPVESLYILSGIAPPDIRRKAVSCRERELQMNDSRHPLHGANAPRKRLKSRSSFLDDVEPQTPETYRMSAWNERVSQLPQRAHMLITPAESLPPGAEAPWVEWRCLNRLRTQVGRSKVNLKKWGYLDGDDRCECGAQQTMAHLLECPCLDEACGPSDLAVYNTAAKMCTEFWSARDV